MVPVNQSEFMLDLMRKLDLPVVVVARSSLGTINHTVLTLRALQAAWLTVAGVVLVGSPTQTMSARLSVMAARPSSAGCRCLKPFTARLCWKSSTANLTGASSTKCPGQTFYLASFHAGCT